MRVHVSKLWERRLDKEAGATLYRALNARIKSLDMTF